MMYLLAAAFHLSLAHAAPPSSLKRQIYARLTVIAKKLDLNVRLDSITAATVCSCAMKPTPSVQGMPLTPQQQAEIPEISRVAPHNMNVQLNSNDDSKALHTLKDIYLSLFKADAPALSGEKYQVGLKIHGTHKVTLQATAHF